MPLKYRRILYLTFITAFFVITPVLVMYTAGYRYNFKKNIIEKTGILYLDSSPDNAQIYINGRFKDETPTRFTKLLPDEYLVEVVKEGYHSWEKKVKIESNLTTFNQDIVLFKKNLPINIVSGEINILAISPDQKIIVYSKIQGTSEELRFKNLKNDSDLLIEKFNLQNYNQLEFIQWSPGQNKALIRKVIGEFNQYLIIDIETLRTKELFDITRLNFSKLIWDDLNDNILYGLRNAVLHQIDLINNSTQSLLSANISDFRIRGEEIYFITKIVNESFLNKTILKDREIDEIEKIKLPSPSEFTLQPTARGFLVLLDENNNDLFIITSSSFDISDLSNSIILQDKAKKIVWSKDRNNLLLYTDFEISTFTFDNSQKNLITRYGEQINQVIWHPDEKYIIFQIANNIKAIEIYGQESKNDTTLTELSEIEGVVIDNVGENLYFKGSAGSQQGIYQLEIQ